MEKGQPAFYKTLFHLKIGKIEGLVSNISEMESKSYPLEASNNEEMTEKLPKL